MEEPLGKSDEIRMSSTVVSVPWSKRSEFFVRLEQAGHRSIAETLRTQRAFNESQKQPALAVIESWMAETSAEEVGPHLSALRYELMRDLRLPPFDK